MNVVGDGNISIYHTASHSHGSPSITAPPPPLTLQDNFIKKRNSTIEAVIDLQRNYNNTVISSEIKFFLERMPLQSCSNAEDALKFTFFKILF